MCLTQRFLNPVIKTASDRYVTFWFDPICDCDMPVGSVDKGRYKGMQFPMDTGTWLSAIR